MSATLKLTELLESLVPNEPQDSVMLREVLSWANKLRQADAVALSHESTLRLQSNAAGGDLFSIFLDLPAAAKRYFHGLVEALDIYHSIHGDDIDTSLLCANAPELVELKKIRDMCLEEGLRSIY